MTVQTSRRAFLKGVSAGAAALVIGVDPRGVLMAAEAADLVPNPFVRVGADNVVTVIAKHFEMGQGTTTGLATLIAEELDADWGQVKVEFAPADPDKYKNLLFGAQGTGGSTAIANSFEQYRKAGAAARDMLVRAAAAKWGVGAGEITVDAGVLREAGGKHAAKFGELVADAARLEVPADPVLKAPKDFKLIGKVGLPRKDTPEKTDGSAIFALDFKLPDMLYAVVARPPKFGGKLRSFDATEAKKVRGVVDVKQIPTGVVVYATNSWAAMKGREALKVEWDLSGAEIRSSDELFREYEAKLSEPGAVARKDGDVAALKSAAKTIEATFRFPYLAHAPMEPLNCVIRFDGKTAELWDGCQFPSLAQPTVAHVLGIKPEDVKINTLYAGGSFGRRANPTSDYHAEAAMAAKAFGPGQAIKLFWTREDDIKGGYYRPMFVHRIRAGIDKDGNPVAWEQRNVGQSIMKGTPFEKVMTKDGIDATSVEGASTLPYAIPNMLVDLHTMSSPLKVLWWRSVGHTHNAYSTEVAIDMLAEAAGEDPVAYRLKLLDKHPRHAGVLKLAAEKAGWGKPLAKGKGRGVAVHESFKSFVAQVVDVSVNEDGAVKVDRVVCAVDCGVAVNPDVIKAQMEGGIGYGLGAIMRNEITLDKGEVVQSNFPDYEPLRLSDMPDIEVHIVPSAEAPTGVGEPGVPPIGPALANAIYAATGKRVFSLPMTASGITFA